MPFTIKILFTAAVVVIGAFVFFLGSGKSSAGPDWMWRTGKNDPIRNLLFRADGSARRYMVSGVLLAFSLLLFIIWVFAPTAP